MSPLEPHNGSIFFLGTTRKRHTINFSIAKIYSPHCDNPDKIVPTATLSIPSPQLVTIHRSAIAFAKSFVVSVLPTHMHARTTQI